MEWVVRAGLATPRRLQDGYVAHLLVPGLYGFSVQYHPGLSVDELARAGQFPNGQISIAYDTALAAAVSPLGYAIRLVPSPGGGYHHTFAVLYDASGTILRTLPDGAAAALSQTFAQQPNPFRVPRGPNPDPAGPGRGPRGGQHQP